MSIRLQKLIVRTFLGLVMFFIALYIIFNSAYVQTKITQAIGNHFGEKWNTVVKLDRVHLEPFKRLGLENVYIEDQHGDTLIYAEKILINFDRFNVFTKTFGIDEIRLDNSNFYLRTYEGEDELNLAFIINTFSSDEDTTDTKGPMRISIDEFEINHTRFIFQNQNELDTSYGIHYSDLDVRDINAIFSHVSILDDSIHFHVESLNAMEKSGVILNDVITQGYINGKGFDLRPLYISMNNSIIDANSLEFTYGEWGNFVDFITKVNMNGDFKVAKILMEDIAFFAPALHGWKQEFKLHGKIFGRVNNLSGHNLNIKTGNKTSFDGNFNIDGLPDIQTSFISVEANELYSELSDLENIQLYPFEEGKKIILPESVKEMGDFVFKGDFTGFLGDFVAYGSLDGKRGKLISDLSLKQLDNGSLQFSGRLKSKDLDLGILSGNSLLGKLDCNIEASLIMKDGKFKSANIDGEIYSIVANNYKYHNIILNGFLEPENYSGKISIDDPALNLDFKGLVNLSNDSIILDFDTDLLYADFGSLNILPIDRYSSISGKIKIDFSGKEWSGLLGKMDATEIAFCTDSADFEFGKISLQNDTINNSRKLILKSDFLSGEIAGEFDLSTIHKDVLWEIGNVLPSFLPNDTTYVPSQNFNFNFVFDDISFLQTLNIFDVNVAPESHISGKIASTKEETILSFISDSLYLLGVNWRSPELLIESTKDEVLIDVYSESIRLEGGPEYFYDNTIKGTIGKDTLDIHFEWVPVDSTIGELNFQTVFQDSNRFEITNKNSYFTFLEKEWVLNDEGRIRFDSTFFSFHDLKLATYMQSIELSGMLGKTKEDTLQVIVNNFELSNFNYILQRFDYSVNGKSNGYIHWIREVEELKLEAELEIDSAGINEYYLGDISLVSKKSSLNSSYLLNISLLDEGYEKLKIAGSFIPTSNSDMLDLNIDLNNLNLGVLNHLNLPGISKIKGKANGLVNLSGTIIKPLLKGKVNIDEGGLYLEVLGADVTFENEIDIYEDYIAIDPFELYDRRGQKAIGYGTLLHEYLKNWNYDFSIDVDNFMVMDLKNENDALFYGKAFGTGTANIWGYNKLLFIDVVATTNAETQIFIPLTESSSVERKEFIEFINKDSLLLDQDEEPPKIDISGVEMNLDINVTPEAEVQLIFDEVTGDILKVRSEGKLALKIDKKGFSMAGSLETYEGEYVFTFESIINKKFEIPRGSKISWQGNPYDANIDITALYNTRASLAPIMVGYESEYKSRVNTYVYLYLKGNLQEPDITFDIELPDSEERERTALRSAISTTEDLNKQVVSLLLFNSFQSVSGWDENGGFATSNTFELLSNQVSNWLSQISDEVDVNVHYRPGTEVAGQEFDVGLTTDILDERVTITTQVGFKDPTINPNATANNIVGDFIIEYKLTEDGGIRLKGFNKSNDNNELQFRQAPYTQGIGIIFRKDFDKKMKREPSDKKALQEKYDKLEVKKSSKEEKKSNKKAKK